MSTPRRVRTFVTIAALALAFGAGYWLRGPAGHSQPTIGSPAPAAAPAAEVWTCSMHPQIRQPKPGQCPICGMDLIPVDTGAQAGGDEPRRLELSPAARRLAEVEVAPVERRAVAVEVRLAGKVQFDETRLATIAPRVAGRVDRLYANYVGTPVKPGEPLAELYSPELVSAQQELLQALPGPEGATGAAALLPAVRERLRLWGLTVEQIAELERSRQVRDHITFYAPIGGIVVEKEAREGMYVEKGMRLFTVADLSQVWVVLDAYESDLAWLRTAQEVSFEAEAYPGETFHGTVAFIAPLVDPMTRTVKVRVNAANADGRLKPELFVRAVVRAPVAADGEDGGLPLVIPASAALLTGKRAVVYVAAPGAEGVFEGRDVTLGPKAGDSYVVRAGLSEGEPVVVKGAFKIDSSLQIQGRPSMMAPGGEGEEARGKGDKERAEGEEARGKAQAICPVMGGEIDREVFVDYQGQRVYFCCPGCREPFLKEPQKYLEKMKAEGVTLEAAPAPAPESHAGHAP